jgi:diguanylate cyclase (GGDEF)-like protein
MSTTSGASGTVLQNARSRRAWYQLEDRHAAMARGRVAVLMVLAVVAAVAPLDMSGSERIRAVAVCVGAVAVHALLAWLPTRWPGRLLAAVDVALVVDALVIGLLALLSGGADSRAVWLLPVWSLAVTLTLAIWPGVKTLILSGLVVGWLTYVEDPQGPLSDSAGPLILAILVVAVAGAAAPVNERTLRESTTRMQALHAASVSFAGAEDDESLTAIAEETARTLLPDWDVVVRLGGDEDRTTERQWRADGKAFIEMPVIGRPQEDGAERAIGTITASRPLPRVGRAFVRRDFVLELRMLATALSAALVQRDLLRRLEHLSMSDPLTGLGNRRAFDEALEVEMARARRAGGSMGVVILDVDHFKQFNDRHGHQAGDDALVTVAQVLAQEARAEDRACRIGGEEFALLLPGADDEAAAAVAERIRRAVETADAEPAGVTVSLGVAASRGDDPRGLLESADARLYVAKEAGRNRVVAS